MDGYERMQSGNFHAGHATPDFRSAMKTTDSKPFRALAADLGNVALALGILALLSALFDR
jgi:hypothetical protein